MTQDIRWQQRFTNFKKAFVLYESAVKANVTSKLEKEGNSLHAFKGSGKPLKNTISLAYVDGRTQSPAASALLDWFVAAFTK